MKLSALTLPVLLCYAGVAQATVSLYANLDTAAAILVGAEEMTLETTPGNFRVTIGDGYNSSQGSSSASLSTPDYALAGTATLEALSTRLQGNPVQPFTPAVMTTSTLAIMATGFGNINVSIPYSFVLTRDHLDERAEVDLFAMDQWFLLDSTSASLEGNELEEQGSGWLTFQLGPVDGLASYEITLANYSFASTAMPVPEPEIGGLMGVGLLTLMLARRRTVRREAELAP